MTGLPLGPVVDSTPRPLPARVAHAGRSVTLVPLRPAHAGDLWQAAAGAEASWTYLPYGPFPSEAALRAQLAALAACHDPLFFAAFPVATGRAAGWLSFLEMRPDHAEIEIGHSWFPPGFARTRAATEVVAILMRHAMDDLGYRRLSWKCDALNDASRHAAIRLGFCLEGIHRNHRIVKGRSRDTASYSMIDTEWEPVREALEAWLDEGNFDEDGQQKRSLAAMRADLTPAS